MSEDEIIYVLRQRVYDRDYTDKQGTVIAVYPRRGGGFSYGVNWDGNGIHCGIHDQLSFLLRPVLDDAGQPVYLAEDEEQ